mgnify:FL=1
MKLPALSQKNINILAGWLMFAIGSLVYILTTEPTAPLWDCPEYTATAVKLEVGHPPGAPLFQMMGAVISNMFDVDPTRIAFMMNVFACLAGGVAIMLLLWAITYFGKRIVGKNWGELSTPTFAAVIGSGIVGSAAILFSDTFWFNATESEVYSLANTFTVLVFYCAIRWADGFGRPRNNKWLILIALLVGLAPGVHFMGMLGVPAVVMIYYFKTTEKKITAKRFILANLVAAAILVLIFAVIFPFLINSFGAADIFLVNTLGAPFHTGTILWAVLLTGICVFLLWWSRRKGWLAVNTTVLALMFIVIGFSCYLMIPIRSNANTPINENNPSTAAGLDYYFSRKQYGSDPLIYGPSYNAKINWSDPYEIGAPTYEPNEETGRYEVIDYDFSYHYLPECMSLFPRISKDRDDYAKNYRALSGLKEGEYPTLSDHLYFFLTYQLGYMNMRYFLWNFVGRQNDYQGRGELTKGNWLSGIAPLDAMRLGPQDPQADYMKDNKALNKYYFLPLILGLIGLYFHFKRKDQDAYATFLFFLITGVGITLYTNNPPYEPRERDYALVTSFWTFGVWIGLGVLALYTWLKKYVAQRQKLALSVGISAICLLAVPVPMACQNWDDHDRSTRTTARAVARNYLSSVGKNGIIVSHGDNDTFPLWYIQEVEGYRTDVRVVNTSLLMCDWYIDQMRRQFYDSPALPLSLPQKMYKGKTNDFVYLNDDPSNPFRDKELDIKTFIDLIRSEHPLFSQENVFGFRDALLPTYKIAIPVNKENAVKYGIVRPEEAPYLEDTLHITIGDSTQRYATYKKTLAFLDFLSNYQWDRPIHFGLGSEANPETNMFGLQDYVILEGLTYKLVPIKIGNLDACDGDRSYQIITQEWEFGGMDNPKTYLSETDLRTEIHIRTAMNRAANALMLDGDTTRARELLNLSVEKMPFNRFIPNGLLSNTIQLLYTANDKQTADSLARYEFDQLEKDVLYYFSFPNKFRMKVYSDARMSLFQYYLLLTYVETNNPELFAEKKEYYEKLTGAFVSLYPFVIRKE